MNNTKILLNLYIRDGRKMINFNEIDIIDINNFNEQLKLSHSIIRGHSEWICKNGTRFIYDNETYISLTTLEQRFSHICSNMDFYIKHLNDFKFTEIKLLLSGELKVLEKKIIKQKNDIIKENIIFEKKS